MATLTKFADLNKLTLRPALFDDAEMLLTWRNDPLTRAESVNTLVVAPEEHKSWLKKLLDNSNRQLFIAEINQNAVGTVRADFDTANNEYELSWTIAPEWRGKGVGKRMVKIMADQLIENSIVARVKPENKASINIALHAGMRFLEIRDGFNIYIRDKRFVQAN